MIHPDFSERLQGENEGYVDIHEQCDINKKIEHIRAAKVLAGRGHRVQLLPEIPETELKLRNKFFPELKDVNFKNPDARFDGLLADFKIPDANPVSKSNINNAIFGTANKKVPVCIISLLDKNYDTREVLRGLQGALKPDNRNTSVKEVWLILRENNVIKIPRAMIRRSDFFKIINAF